MQEPDREPDFVVKIESDIGRFYIEEGIVTAWYSSVQEERTSKIEVINGELYKVESTIDKHRFVGKIQDTFQNFILERDILS